MSLLSFVIVQVRLGRSNRCSAASRLAGDSSLWRANFLQLVLELWLNWIWKVRRSPGDSRDMHLQGVMQCTVGADSAQGGTCDRGWSCGGSTCASAVLNGSRWMCCRRGVDLWLEGVRS
jgi:hypothetical protein